MGATVTAPPAPREFPSYMRDLVELYYDYQDVRIRSYNRLLKRHGETIPPELTHILDFYKDGEAFEKRIYEELKPVIVQHPLWVGWLSKVVGIGPVLGCGFIVWIEPISRFDNISKLWSYAGLGVEGGKAPKRQKGRKANWNWKLKVHCWKAVRSFIMQKGSEYGSAYRHFKAEEVVKHGGGEDGHQCTAPLLHIDLRARRKTAKLFLSHLWTKWREIEGLSVTEPYMGRLLGHEVEPPYEDRGG